MRLSTACALLLCAPSLLLACAPGAPGPRGASLGDEATDHAAQTAAPDAGSAAPMSSDAPPTPDAGLPEQAATPPSYGEQLRMGQAALRGDASLTCDGSDALCEVSAEAGLDTLLGYGRGAAVADVDGDGFDDLLVIDSDSRDREDWGRTQLYRNRGDGSFEPMPGVIEDDAVVATWVASFGDLDNDGDPDLLLGNGGYTGTGDLRLLENRLAEEGRFVDVTDAAGLDTLNRVADDAPASSWWGLTLFDYDNDGLLDAVATRLRQQPVVLHNDGGLRLSDRTGALGIALDTERVREAKNPVAFDRDGDGDQDLYLAGIYQHALFENRGPEGFVDVTAEAFGDLLPEGEPYVFAAVAEDFDQDGRDDLYLGRWSRQDYLLLNRGDGSFDARGQDAGLDMSLSSGEPGEPIFENTMGLGAGDLFDDGFPDILIGTGKPDLAVPDIAYCNDGSASFTRCSDLFETPDGQHFDTRGHGTVFLDVERDGDTDVFRNLGGHPLYDTKENLARAEAGLPQDVDTREENKLWAQQADAPHTATLSLVGSHSNRDAIGAQVTVRGTTTRYYTVRSTQGFQSQNSHSLIIDLGDAPQLQVVIAWPSGQVSTAFARRGVHHRLTEPR